MSASDSVSPLFHRVAHGLAGLTTRHPLRITLLAVALGLVSLLASQRFLSLRSGRNEVVSADAPFNQRYVEFLEKFGDKEFLLAVIEPPVLEPDEAMRERMRALAERIARRLREHPELFLEVETRVDPTGFRGTQLLYQSRVELEHWHQRLESVAPELAPVLKSGTLAALFEAAERSLEKLAENPPENAEELGPVFTVGSEILDWLIAKAQGQQASPFPLTTMLEARERRAGYLFTLSGRRLLVLTLPRGDPNNLVEFEAPFARLREIVAEEAASEPDFTVGITGRPAIYSEELTTSQRDMTRASIIAIFCVGLLLVCMFHSIRQPLLAVVCLLLAISWTYGWTSLFPGHLTLLSMAFQIVLISLGIDFAIHFLTHYRLHLRPNEGVGPELAIERTFEHAGPGLLTGGLTTSLAFFTAMLTPFAGLAELGLVAGSGIVFCLLGALVVLPSLLALTHSRGPGHRHPRALYSLDGMRVPPVIVRAGQILAVGLLLAGCLSAWRPPTFDFDLLRLQAISAPAVQWERLLIAEGEQSTFTVSLAHDRTELAERQQQFETLIDAGILTRVEGLLPEDEADKRQLLGELAQTLAGLPSGPAGDAQEPALDADALARAIRRLKARCKELARRDEQAAGPLTEMDQKLGTLYRALRQQTQTSRAGLAGAEQELFAGVHAALDQLEALARPPPVDAEHLPDFLRQRYVGSDGTLALYLHPRKSVWIPDELREFIAATRAIDPYVLGPPVQIFESQGMIVESFTLSTIYASLAILVLVFFDLRDLRRTLLALLPVASGLLMLAGLMVAFDLQFNFANFFAVPILIGLGVDAGVHLVHAAPLPGREQVFRRTQIAVIVSALTTVLGFGTLLIADHRGVRSLGLLIVLGTLTCLLSSLTLLAPWLRRQARRTRSVEKPSP